MVVIVSSTELYYLVSRTTFLTTTMAISKEVDPSSFLEAACKLWPMLSEEGRKVIMDDCERFYAAFMREEHKIMLEEKRQNGGKCIKHEEMTPEGRQIVRAMAAYVKLLQLDTGKGNYPIMPSVD